jgi:hypothetical protein
MTVFGGDPILAADINELIGRINTTILTADSATWGATETQATSITINAIAGAKYKIQFNGRISTDIAADASVMRIREDSLAGNVLQYQQVYLPTTSTNAWPCVMYAEWTAPSTASKTFSLTGQRLIGTGTAHRIRAAGSGPGYLYVDRIAD